MRIFFNKLKNVRFRDIIAIFKLLIAIAPSFFVKLYFSFSNKDLWLICEEEYEACDNGIALFEYINKEHSEYNTRYAINYNSKYYKKVESIGKTVKYGTIGHWIFYLSAKANISSQKGGKPNAAVCYFLEVYGILKNNRFFLQHGVIMNDTEFLHYTNTKMRMFVCGAYPEFNYVKDNFGYPEGYVQYLGLCRFDNLHNNLPNPKKVLLMPTWRNWFKLNSSTGEDIDFEKKNFVGSEYYKNFQALIGNQKLIRFLEKNNIFLYFYPHRNLQQFLSEFVSYSNNIVLAYEKNYNIQQLLKDTSLMITDYSSVSIDFSYMKKPIIYYQFDEKKFRKHQYKKGYFDYRENGFGSVFDNENEVINKIIDYCENDFVVENIYLKRQSVFFKLYDNKNCERNFDAIKKILEDQ